MAVIGGEGENNSNNNVVALSADVVTNETLGGLTREKEMCVE